MRQLQLGGNVIHMKLNLGPYFEEIPLAVVSFIGS